MSSDAQLYLAVKPLKPDILPHQHLPITFSGWDSPYKGSNISLRLGLPLVLRSWRMASASVMFVDFVLRLVLYASIMIWTPLTLHQPGHRLWSLITLRTTTDQDQGTASRR